MGVAIGIDLGTSNSYVSRTADIDNISHLLLLQLRWVLAKRALRDDSNRAGQSYNTIICVFLGPTQSW